MKFVSYNIQYSKGKDGIFDLERVADAVRGADVIGLQEVARNFPDAPDADQVARLAELLPEYFWAYGSPTNLDFGSTVENGKAVSRRFELGQMLLTRWPIMSSRNLLLPRIGTQQEHDLQNGALEGVVDLPDGPLRIYVTHLNYLRSATRKKQLDWLVPELFSIAANGTSITGKQWRGIPLPPTPSSFVIMGDFNLTPQCKEYGQIVGEGDYYSGHVITNDHWVDTWTQCGNDEENSTTWFDEAKNFETGYRLDYGFVSPDLATKVKDARIDQACPASDHQPYWFELDV